MQVNIRKKKIISIILIAFLMITTRVYAANDSFKTTLKANKSEFKAGDTVTITMGLSNIAIESGDKGIGGYTANIKFDTSVLEYVKTTATDTWEKPFYEDGIIVGNTNDGEVVKTAQSIGTITFKVKENAKLGETTISLTEFLGSTGLTDVETSDTSIKVKIVNKDSSSGDNDKDNNDKDNNDKDQNGGNNNSGNNNNDKNEGNNNGSNTNNNNNSNKNPNTGDKLNVIDTSNEKENKKDGMLPQAGQSNIVLYTLIGVSIVTATVFYVKMKIANKN